MTYHFLRSAIIEMDDSAAYYEKQADGLGDEFLDEVEAAIERVLLFPQAWGKVNETYFHCHLRRFPLTLIYTFTSPTEITFVSVFHQSREPGSWRKNS